ECGQRREGTRSVGGGSGKRREYLPGLTQGGGSLFVRPNYRTPAGAGRPFPPNGVALGNVGGACVPRLAATCQTPFQESASSPAERCLFEFLCYQIAASEKTGAEFGVAPGHRRGVCLCGAKQAHLPPSICGDAQSLARAHWTPRTLDVAEIYARFDEPCGRDN